MRASQSRFGSALNGGPSGWLGPRKDARAGAPRHGRLSPSTLMCVRTALKRRPHIESGPRMDARAGVDRHGWLSPRSTEAKPCRVRVSRTTSTRRLGLRSGIRVSRNCRCATGAPDAHIVSGFGRGFAFLETVGAPQAHPTRTSPRASVRASRVSRNCRCATGAPYAHIGFGFDSVMASVPIASARFQTLVSLIETSDSQRVSRFPR